MDENVVPFASCNRRGPIAPVNCVRGRESTGRDDQFTWPGHLAPGLLVFFHNRGLSVRLGAYVFFLGRNAAARGLWYGRADEGDLVRVAGWRRTRWNSPSLAAASRCAGGAARRGGGEMWRVPADPPHSRRPLTPLRKTSQTKLEKALARRRRDDQFTIHLARSPRLREKNTRRQRAREGSRGAQTAGLGSCIKVRPEWESSEAVAPVASWLVHRVDPVERQHANGRALRHAGRFEAAALLDSHARRHNPVYN